MEKDNVASDALYRDRRLRFLKVAAQSGSRHFRDTGYTSERSPDIPRTLPSGQRGVNYSPISSKENCRRLFIPHCER